MARLQKFVSPNLRQFVTLQEKTVSGQDEFGADEYTWTDVTDMRLEILPLRGRELEAVQQTWAEARFKATGRYYSSVERAMSLSWGTRRLDILDAEDPDGRGVWIVIYCKELVD